ncbi:MAG: tyrosine--tRNA ligase [Saprospiraceae bacterium]|nr:tyrosine--tRNA ligase [Saprospiraceae bacterium]
MDFIGELRWRGMLQDMSEGVEDALAQQSACGYIGFDPTAPSLTIGNYVQVMILHFFQQAGHTPVVLMGGATGRVGDPSGKDKERELLDEQVLEKNLSHQMNQLRTLLDFKSGSNRAQMVNNFDFYKDMDVLTFLRDVGKTLTVNYMLAKESVKNRLDKGISFTEFSYQLLQAYDFLCLFRERNCIVQMGGSDQWGNITSGTEFIRRHVGGKAFAITTPLLTKSDGSKFGKSSEGNIWLDAEMTSPYKFYQFWINTDDRDIGRFLRYFSYRDQAAIELLEAEYHDDLQQLKKVLAEELTRRIHGDDNYDAVVKVSELLFNRKADKGFLAEINISQWKAVAGEIPRHEIMKTELQTGINVIDFLTEATSIVDSKGDARRAIKGNAISINKEKISDFEMTINMDKLLHGQFLMVENGKKNKYLVEAI